MCWIYLYSGFRWSFIVQVFVLFLKAKHKDLCYEIGHKQMSASHVKLIPFEININLTEL